MSCLWLVLKMQAKRNNNNKNWRLAGAHAITTLEPLAPVAFGVNHKKHAQSTSEITNQRSLITDQTSQIVDYRPEDQK